MACHGDTTLTATMQDAALAPLRPNLGYLSERNGAVGVVDSTGSHRYRRRDTQILDVREGHVGIVLHNDGQFVIVFPNLTNTQVARCGT